MTKYRLTYSVRRARGAQSFIVEAATPEDAIAAHDAGNSAFEHEEVEVYDLSEVPDVEEIKP